MTTATYDYKARWEAIRSFKETDDPKVAAANERWSEASRVEAVARAAFDKAKRSRAADKEQRVADAEGVWSVTLANRDAAQTSLAAASREPERRNYLALNDLAMGIAHDVLNEVEHLDLASAIGSIQFVNTYKTGRMVKRLYDTDEYEEVEARAEDGHDDNTIAVEKGDIRIKWHVGDRGSIQYTVQRLDEKTGPGGARLYRFGYEAQVNLNRYDGWTVKVSWGSYSGMNTLVDVQNTIDVHRVALALAQTLTQTLLAS